MGCLLVARFGCAQLYPQNGVCPNVSCECGSPSPLDFGYGSINGSYVVDRLYGVHVSRPPSAWASLPWDVPGLPLAQCRKLGLPDLAYGPEGDYQALGKGYCRTRDAFRGGRSDGRRDSGYCTPQRARVFAPFWRKCREANRKSGTDSIMMEYLDLCLGLWVAGPAYYRAPPPTAAVEKECRALERSCFYSYTMRWKRPTRQCPLQAPAQFFWKCGNWSRFHFGDWRSGVQDRYTNYYELKVLVRGCTTPKRCPVPSLSLSRSCARLEAALYNNTAMLATPIGRQLGLRYGLKRWGRHGAYRNPAGWPTHVDSQGWVVEPRADISTVCLFGRNRSHHGDRLTVTGCSRGCAKLLLPYWKQCAGWSKFSKFHGKFEYDTYQLQAPVCQRGPLVADPPPRPSLAISKKCRALVQKWQLIATDVHIRSKDRWAMGYGTDKDYKTAMHFWRSCTADHGTKAGGKLCCGQVPPLPP